MESQLLTGNYWYVLYTLPNYERNVAAILNRNQITSFLPLQKTVKQWSDRRKVVEVPLFPNYLFVNLNDKTRFDVLNTNGVRRYISLDGKPVIVKETEIDNIKRMTTFSKVNLENDFIKGEQIKVIDGPFAGMYGFFYEKLGQSRFCIKVESLNQIVSVELSSAQVISVNR